MKYKLTDEVKYFCGITHHRIRAIEDFANVKSGDLGGWVEKENNLDQNGNCWIYDNAQVSGNARVYGDAWVSKTPICVSGLYWYVTITDRHMQIGCQVHTIKVWNKMKDESIEKMDKNALAFWKAHKNILMELCKVYCIQ